VERGTHSGYTTLYRRSRIRWLGFGKSGRRGSGFLDGATDRTARILDNLNATIKVDYYQPATRCGVALLRSGHIYESRFIRHWCPPRYAPHPIRAVTGRPQGIFNRPRSDGVRGNSRESRWVTLTSLSAYRKSILQVERSGRIAGIGVDQFAEEDRTNFPRSPVGSPGSGFLQWILGGYYFTKLTPFARILPAVTDACSACLTTPVLAVWFEADGKTTTRATRHSVGDRCHSPTGCK